MSLDLQLLSLLVSSTINCLLWQISKHISTDVTYHNSRYILCFAMRWFPVFVDTELDTVSVGMWCVFKAILWFLRVSGRMCSFPHSSEEDDCRGPYFMAAQRAKGSDPQKSSCTSFTSSEDMGFWELSSAKFHWGSRKGYYLCQTTIAGEAVDHLPLQTVTVVLADSPAC